ncbi:putative ATP-dependent RNA helicase protein [Oceanicola granulosus HTCC2516]|uniref:Putative ATP-dependent RNA helicase protein n=1 Tax=Oceanicola granulosus (strain ATCC BAA-861 / DSM 15982 / KCTC 12143 / HTCC2516) TaxID=314256 RepID=Q2CE16_OCEGH|nr:DEAD/DEAH box helicase [Oceanicola granulosus]EAR50922.1 putative ATP-dependent RNA helicase protein [Oceanicola granulosus HTCC2516]
MTFENLGLSPRLAARLAEQGLTAPTPIQTQAIPHALEGRDVLGLAQTGTGKTAAFGLPLIQALTAAGTHAAPNTVLALILAPTRELAAQIVDSLRAFAGNGGSPRIGLVVGGKSINAQANALRRGTDILVATPGRLIDLLDRKALTLGKARYLVLDEADQMLDLGFIHALRRIAPLLPKERQTMLFSATMPKQMSEIAGAYLTDPVRVQVSPPGKPADKVDQSVHFVAKDAKQALLIDLLDAHRDERALVFARTKHGAERLMKQLDRAGFAASSIHGNKSQGQRNRALDGFREGKVRVLVATDVAARGIDIPGVGYVYNYELPNVPENYVHRIGRTARAGADGRAVAFCGEEEMGELRDIEKVLGKPIAIAGGSPWQVAGGGKPGKPRGQQPPRRRRSRRPARKAA